MPFLRLLAVALALLLSNCAYLKTETVAGQSLNTKKSFYVERHPKEDWNFHQMIADEIAFRGYTASAGEPGHAPAAVDAIVTYNDRWYWDMSPYLLQLDIRILDAKTRSLIASGTSYRPSLQRKSPKNMAKETVGVIFGSVKENRQPYMRRIE